MIGVEVKREISYSENIDSFFWIPLCGLHGVVHLVGITIVQETSIWSRLCYAMILWKCHIGISRGVWRLGLASIYQPHQSNCRASSDASDDNHLDSSFNSSKDILAALPPSYNTRFNITKDEQCDGHNRNAAVQCENHMADKEIRNKRDEPANEVS